MGEFIAVRVQDRDDVPIHSAQHLVTSVAKKQIKDDIWNHHYWKDDLGGTWIVAGREAC